jgi:hypothetical protein
VSQPEAGAQDSAGPSDCVVAFTSLPASCPMASDYAPQVTPWVGNVDMCSIAHGTVASMCTGVADTAGTAVCGPSVPSYPTASSCARACAAGDAVCVFDCYDAAVFGITGAGGLDQCIVAAVDKTHAIDCFCTASQYPVLYTTAWFGPP